MLIAGCSHTTRSHTFRWQSVAVAPDARALAALAEDEHTTVVEPAASSGWKDNREERDTRYLLVGIDPRSGIIRRTQVGWSRDTGTEGLVQIAAPVVWLGGGLRALDFAGRLHTGIESTDRRVVLGGTAAIAWDGDGNHLRLWDAQSGRTVTTRLPAAALRRQALSDDRARLVLLRQATDGAPQVQVLGIDLRSSLAAGTMKIDGDRTVSLPPLPSGDSWSIEAIAPSGRYLVSASFRSLVVLDVDTGTPVLSQAALPEQVGNDCQAYDDFDFLSDQLLLVRRPEGTMTIRLPDGAVTKLADECHAAFDPCREGWGALRGGTGGALLRCSDGKLLQAAGLDESSSFFRAGRRAFAQVARGEAGDKLLVFDLDAATVTEKPLPPTASNLLAASADARTLVFASFGDFEDLMLYDVASGRVTTVKSR